MGESPIEGRRENEDNHSRGHGLALLLAASAASAQSNPRYVQFSPSATKGALYTPDSGPAPTIAFLTIHRTSNFMSLIATRELAKRGFMVLGMNSRSDNNEASVNFEDVALDIRQGVEFLRRQPGIQKVILIGHSGGGPATTFYQATAEKGVSYCNAPNKLTKCSDAFADLPKADGMLLLDAHPGTRSIPCAASIRPCSTRTIRQKLIRLSIRSILRTVSIRMASRSIARSS